MNINTFDNEISPNILKRGKEYFSNAAVKNLQDLGDGRYAAVVAGSYSYKVQVALAKDGDIYSLGCNCPYELGDICKHEVAVLLAIRKDPIAQPSEKKRKVKKEEIDLKAVLEQQSKEALVDLLYSLTEADSTLKQSLELRFSRPDDELTISKKLIKESIRRYKKQGFIEYGKVFPALAGAWDVVKKANSYIKSDCMRSIPLYLLVLHEVFAMTQYSDDSNGELGEIMDYITNQLELTVLEASNALPKTGRDELFYIILKEANNKVYDGWLSFGMGFLKILIPLCGDPALYQKLWDELGKRKALSKDLYKNQILAEQQYQLLSQWGSKEESESFLQANIERHNFRKHAIKRAMEQADYAAALHYAEGGIAQASKEKHSNFLRECQKAAFEAYVAMGNIEKMRELAEYFVKHDLNGMAYYGILKDKTPEAEWEPLLQKIFAFFDAQAYKQETYTKILLIEKEYERLFAFCCSNLSKITEFAAAFPNEYKESTEKLYTKFIWQATANATGRASYKIICRYLKDFGKLYGKDKANELVQQLKAQYRNRPAFVDELEKLK
ncbi:MAG: hypothetical protein LBV04_07220 [Deferribacteraceae bacterium]|jgi:hypothetical protein|nr:hypothetical protein [Deferribacteraceae bacterium]